MSDSPPAIPWGSALWDQQRAIETFTEEGIAFVQVAHEFARKRAAVESEYSKNLSKLVKEYTSKLGIEDEPGTSAGSINQPNATMSPIGGTLSRKSKRFSLRNQSSAEQLSTATPQMRSWANFLQETGAVAAAHQTTSEQIDEKVTERLKTEARNLTNLRKQLIAQAKVYRADLQRTVESIDKLRKHAEATARSADDSRTTFEKCLLENGSKSSIEKFRIDFDQRASLANKAAEQHLEAMSNIEELRRVHHLEQIPSVLDALQKMEKDRLVTVGDTLERFAKILAENAAENQRRMENAGREIASVDPVSILDEFTKQHKSGKPVPVYGESTTAMVLDEMADADESEHALQRANLSRSSGNLGMAPTADGGTSLESILVDDDFFHGSTSAESLRQASIRLREVERAMADTSRTRQAVEALRGIYLRDYAGSMAPAPVTVALTGANAQIAELTKQERELEIRHQRLSNYLAGRYGTKTVHERRSVVSILGSLTGQQATIGPKYNTLGRSGVKSTGVEEDWAASIMKEVAERIGADVPPRRDTLGDMSPSRSHSRNLTSPESPIRPRRVTSAEQYAMAGSKKYTKPITLITQEKSNVLQMQSKLQSVISPKTTESVVPDKARTPLETTKIRPMIPGIPTLGGTSVPSTIPSLPEAKRFSAERSGIAKFKSEKLKSETEGGLPSVPRVVALYAFSAQPSSCELSIEQGDELRLLEREPEGASGWCRVEDAAGEEGFVPLSYVDEIIGEKLFI